MSNPWDRHHLAGAIRARGFDEGRLMAMGSLPVKCAFRLTASRRRLRLANTVAFGLPLNNSTYVNP